MENQTASDLSLKIGDYHYTVPPQSHLPVSLSGGESTYYATEPGIIPATGSHEFRRGYRYTWKFWIVTTAVGLP